MDKMNQDDVNRKFNEIIAPLQDEQVAREAAMHRTFDAMTADIEKEHVRQRDEAFQVEARPIPADMITEPGHIPPGHIANVGDFDTPPQAPASPSATK